MATISNETTSIDNDLWAAHRRLADFNHQRLDPSLPSNDWRARLDHDNRSLHLEGEVLEWERSLVADRAAAAPTLVDDFMIWFEGLRETGPGQNSALFPWLAECATHEQMKWFISQEVAGEAGFDDLCAMTQIKAMTEAKLGIARNYWDEMGRGRETGMHGPMLERVAREFELEATDLDQCVPEALALANIMLGLAANRRYAYQSIGALGVVELTAPDRAKLTYEGLKRLGLSPEAQQYYLLHSSLDVKHSLEWNRDVIRPIVARSPGVARAIAEGALMRLNAGARCYESYARHFELVLH